MMCMAQSFRINTAIFHKTIRMVEFDFPESQSYGPAYTGFIKTLINLIYCYQVTITHTTKSCEI